MSRERGESLLRAGLLGLAAAGIVGTAVELASLRHWDSFDQLIPWFVLGVLAVGVVLVARATSRTAVRAGQAISLVSFLGGAYGLIEHVAENLGAGPLDRVYGARWDSMNGMSHLWAAVSGAVGPAPLLAPAVLGQIGLCLLLATIAHPATTTALPSEPWPAS